MTVQLSAPGPRYSATLQLLRTAESLWNGSRLFFARWDLSPSQFNVLNLLLEAPAGLTQTDLEKRLGEDIQLMRLVEEHLRPSIHIDAHSVETYYQDQLLPQLRKRGSREAPLPEVSARIKNLLAEQKLNELITSWLESLRSESRISTASEGERNR